MVIVQPDGTPSPLSTTTMSLPVVSTNSDAADQWIACSETEGIAAKFLNSASLNLQSFGTHVMRLILECLSAPSIYTLSQRVQHCLNMMYTNNYNSRVAAACYVDKNGNATLLSKVSEEVRATEAFQRDKTQFLAFLKRQSQSAIGSIREVMHVAVSDMIHMVKKEAHFQQSLEWLTVYAKLIRSFRNADIGVLNQLHHATSSRPFSDTNVAHGKYDIAKLITFSTNDRVQAAMVS